MSVHRTKGENRIVVLIPARYQSTRLPGKLLQPILGKSILQRSYESALKSSLVDSVFIVTSDLEILSAAEAFKADIIFLPNGVYNNGTERIAGAAKRLGVSDSTILINLQADTFGDSVPKLLDYMLSSFIQATHSDPDDDFIFTPVCPLPLQHASFFNSDVVKCIVGLDGSGIFLRQLSEKGLTQAWRHYGIYLAFAKYFYRYLKEKETELEKECKLEQVRWSRVGVQIRPYYWQEPNPMLWDVNTESDLSEVADRISQIEQEQLKKVWFNGACGGSVA